MRICIDALARQVFDNIEITLLDNGFLDEGYLMICQACIVS